MTKHLVLAVLALVLSGCSTHSAITPELTGKARIPINNPPIETEHN